MLKSKMSRIFGGILGFFGIMTFTACYGMPANYSGASGTVSGDIDGDGKTEALKGIEVTLKDSAKVAVDAAKTDSSGRFYLETDKTLKGDCSLEFKDVDGAENGAFKAKVLSLTFSGSDDEFLTRNVVLEREE